MKVFFDSSAFAKRYIEEQESDKVQQICLRASQLAVSVICLPEVISALCRLKRTGALTRQQYETAKKGFFTDLRDVVICNLNPTVISRSIRVLEKSSIRAMDALHLACALEWRAGVFVSADARQVLVAQAEGFKVLYICTRGEQR
jgi:predicted nucleic acid-binding protein